MINSQCREVIEFLLIWPMLVWVLTKIVLRAGNVQMCLVMQQSTGSMSTFGEMRLTY